MKKSLLALAALATVSGAFAQSSVTLYGIADAYIANRNNGGGTSMGSGGLSGSRLGFKGTEDLGGGLKALFVFEEAIDIETGAAGGTVGSVASTFNRQAYLGLESSYGTLVLGNAYTALDDLNAAAMDGWDSMFSAYANAWVGYTYSPGSNIKYITPEFGGFTGAASYTRKQTGDKVIAVQGSYNNGPIYAGMAYQTDEVSVPGQNIKHFLVNGTYDLGSVKLLGSYRNVKDRTAGISKTQEFQFGADVPLSSALVLSAGVAQSKDKAGGAQIDKRTGLGLALKYSLSKRTDVYGGLNSTKTTSTGVTDRVYAVGVRHMF